MEKENLPKLFHNSPWLTAGRGEKYEENKQKRAFFVRWLLACQASRLDAETISVGFAALC